jgi:hypothetical protein
MTKEENIVGSCKCKSEGCSNRINIHDFTYDGLCEECRKKREYSWEEVHKKADEIIESLIKSNYSGQDIIHIGETIHLVGNYVHARDMQKWMRGYDLSEKIKIDGINQYYTRSDEEPLSKSYLEKLEKGEK